MPEGRDHELPDPDQRSETVATRALIAERDHLRAALCHAKIVRHLLTVAIGHIDLASALETLNLTLTPYAGIKLTGIAAVDLDTATALGADLPSTDEEPIIDDWQAQLSRCAEPHLLQHGAHVLVPAVDNHHVVGLARTTPTTLPVGKEVAAALRSGLGEAIHLAKPTM